MARGSAGSLDYVRRDYVVAEGGVELVYQDLKFQGERVEVDLESKTVHAVGGVIVDQGPRRITGDSLDFDLETKTGAVQEAKAYVDPDIYFTGSEVEKLGDDLYRVTDAMVTSCAGESPVWSFRAGKSRIRVGGYARAKHTTMRIKKFPILYAPYLLFPTEQDRKSGFLFPNLGYSSRRGSLLGNAYYQTLGDSYDATLFADYYTDSYLGLGAEFRYRPTLGTGGIFEGYAIDDPVRDEVRWKARVTHTSDDLPWNLRGVVDILQFSDFEYTQDFERNFNQYTLARLVSSAFVSGNWGAHSFNVVVEERENFIRTNDSLIQRQFPEVEYRLRQTQLWRLPLYLGLESSAHYLGVERPGIIDENWSRFHLAPQLTAPLSYWPWLSFSMTAGGRMTHYTDSLDVTGTAFAGESLTRTVPTFNAEVIGPSLSKIFDLKAGPFGKFKHIVEPRWAYAFIGEFDEQRQVPIFDEIDGLLSGNVFAVALVNRLLAKPQDETSLLGTREILTFELVQLFSLNDDEPLQSSRDGTRTTTRGPIGASLRFNPFLATNFTAQATYDTLFDRLESASLSGGTKLGRHGVGVTYFSRFNPETGDTINHQVRLYTAFELVPARLRLSSQVNYDFVASLLLGQRHVLEFNAQCYGMRFEVVETRTELVTDRDFRFSVSLKNLGTFLDLGGGGSFF